MDDTKTATVRPAGVAAGGKGAQTHGRMLKKISKYEIQAELGHGGFGCVYKAYDPTVGRLVAIKVLTGPGERDVFLRFRKEATTAGNLRHKNIVTVHEFGEQDGVPYLVMEYIEGRELREIIARKTAMPLLEKVQIMAQVADGLNCAHRHGVVHRDVKPANIMIQPDGVVKIMDFGIARMTGEDSARLTQQGDLVGTVLYMSPEQFQGGEADALSDIFGYGVTYYEFLTYSHPFQAPDLAALVLRITAENPTPIRSFTPECPPLLEQVISRAVQKERELRYQSLEDLQLDVEPVLIELRRERAATLLEEGRRHMLSDQLDLAHSTIRLVLDLDPANLSARQLRESIQRELTRRTVRPRIESLLKAADEARDQGKFGEAVQRLEAAARLDPDDVEIWARLESAKSMAGQQRKVAELMADARTRIQTFDHTGAHRRLSEILKIDPANREAAVLLENVARESNRAEQERRLQEGLEKARGLYVLADYDQTVAVLTELERIRPDDPDVRSLLDHARQAIAARDRARRFEEQVDAARKELKASRFAEAVRILEPLDAEYPNEPRVADLLRYARQEEQRIRRTRIVGTASTDARTALAAGDPGKADSILAAVLREYPEEQELLSLRQTAASAIARDAAVQEILRRSKQLEAEGKFDQAIQLVDAGLQQYQTLELLALKQDLEKVKALNIRHLEAMRKVLREEPERAPAPAKPSPEPPRPSPAEEQIHQLRQWRADGRARDVLNEATRILSQQDSAEVRDMMDWAEQTLQLGKLGAGEVRTEESESTGERRRRPGTLLIAACVVGVMLLAVAYWIWRSNERAKAIGVAIAQSQELLNSNQAAEAVKGLNEALSRFPGEPSLQNALTLAQNAERRPAGIGESAPVTPAAGREPVPPGLFPPPPLPKRVLEEAKREAADQAAKRTPAAPQAAEMRPPEPERPKASSQNQPSESQPAPAQQVSAAVPVPTQTPAAPPVQPEPYYGNPNLVLQWGGNLEPQGRLTIRYAAASAGTVSPRLPRTEGTVSVTSPGIVVLAQPSAQNGYALELQNTNAAPVMAIRIVWKQRK